MARQPDHVYGGCDMSNGRPARACLACNHRWGLLVTEILADGKRIKRAIDDPEIVAAQMQRPEIQMAIENYKKMLDWNIAAEIQFADIHCSDYRQ